MDESYRNLLMQAERYACEYLDEMAEKPAFPSEKHLAGLKQFCEPLPAEGTEAASVIEQLHSVGAAGTTAQIGGRYYGFVNGGLLPVAHAAEWIADTWNANGALYAMSPVASVLEQVCENWIRELFGLPEGTALGLVTGSSNALLCALAAARNELLARQGYSVAKSGLRSAPPVRVVLGAGAHGAVASALSVLGIGTDDIVRVPTDHKGRMLPAKVPQMDERTLLILQAGHVNGGSFDFFDELCSAANKAGAWVHIDGAFGLWAACSKKYRYLVKGMEKADSWNCDAHKTLNAGYDCGLVLCRHRESLVQALQISGPYIPRSKHRDNMLYTTEMSRRVRGVILWAVLKYLGKSGAEHLVDHLCDSTAYFAGELAKIGLILVNPPCFNQFMVRGHSEAETLRILNFVQRSGICWCGGSQWEGQSVIRISVCSHETTKADIDMSVLVFNQALNNKCGI
ncbi:MAG: aspartate aminotransferase family protein, partial [Desulfovibrionaceae bacterium]|nr:aspartate aminotransferase family protein [Desulfovibrionaceae bacterium]